MNTKCKELSFIKHQDVHWKVMQRGYVNLNFSQTHNSNGVQLDFREGYKSDQGKSVEKRVMADLSNKEVIKLRDFLNSLPLTD